MTDPKRLVPLTLDDSFEELDLSARARKVLAKDGCKTIGDVVQKAAQKEKRGRSWVPYLTTLQNCGRTTVNHIEEVLEREGFSLNEKAGKVIKAPERAMTEADYMERERLAERHIGELVSHLHFATRVFRFDVVFEDDYVTVVAHDQFGTDIYSLWFDSLHQPEERPQEWPYSSKWQMGTLPKGSGVSVPPWDYEEERRNFERHVQRKRELEERQAAEPASGQPRRG